jgi:RHS repeat-associated protein
MGVDSYGASGNRMSTGMGGSTAITANSSGTKIAELRYYPWGERRYYTGSIPTNYQFTGQRMENDLGIYFYNARWYDPATGRFMQADTVVTGGVPPKEQAGDQGLDRYAYANNNPIRYTDPSGHAICTDDGYCGRTSDTAYQSHIYKNAITDVYKWNLLGRWNLDELKAIYKTGSDIQTYTNTITGGNGIDWMNNNLGGINISHVGSDSPSYVPRGRDSAFPALLSGTGKQTVFLVGNWLTANGDGQGSRWLAHEMGHVWDMHTGILGSYIGGVADKMNGAMGGNISSNPFTCRYCDGSGPGNTNIFTGGYGNNSSADYQVEVFALSVYPTDTNPVPSAAQDWMIAEIQRETILMFINN